jgi:hypothetical protein
MDRGALIQKFVDLYGAEHDALGEPGNLELLDQGRQWNLAPVLEAGGILLFPHGRPADCGHQVGAVVNAVLDSDADTCVFVSVLHASSEGMQDARVQVAAGENPADFNTWGIQGPGLDFRDDWKRDHAPTTFRRLLAAETKRRGIAGPRVVERFPYLAGGKPHRLPGVDEFASLCENAVVVTTADSFHHGIGYGTPPEDSYAPEAGGFELATASILKGCQLLQQQDYWGYNQHCVADNSDHRDAGQLLAHIRGPMKGQILDLVASEFGDVYDAPAPSWVAAALVTYTLI